MILGYGMHGQHDVALELFDLMKDDGVDYDHVSYIAVLSVCSHGCLVERQKSTSVTHRRIQWVAPVWCGIP